MKRAKDLILAFLAHIGFSLLGFCMTSHTKRFVLLASLQVHLVREGILRDETMSKLNEALDLVKYEDALEFPVMLHDTIWGGLKLEKILQTQEVVNLTNTCLPYSELRRVATEFVNQAPPWLHYGKERVDMLQDIMRLLSCQPELHASATA